MIMISRLINKLRISRSITVLLGILNAYKITLIWISALYAILMLLFLAKGEISFWQLVSSVLFENLILLSAILFFFVGVTIRYRGDSSYRSERLVWIGRLMRWILCVLLVYVFFGFGTHREAHQIVYLLASVAFIVAAFALASLAWKKHVILRRYHETTTIRWNRLTANALTVCLFATFAASNIVEATDDFGFKAASSLLINVVTIETGVLLLIACGFLIKWGFQLMGGYGWKTFLGSMATLVAGMLLLLLGLFCIMLHVPMVDEITMEIVSQSIAVVIAGAWVIWNAYTLADVNAHLAVAFLDVPASVSIVWEPF